MNKKLDPTLINALKAQQVIDRIETRLSKEKQVNIRLTEEQYKLLEIKMKEYKFSTMSEYLRFVGLNANIEIKVNV